MSPPSLVGLGGQAPTDRQAIHAASYSIKRPEPAKISLGGRSGLPLQFCRQKNGLGFGDSGQRPCTRVGYFDYLSCADSRFRKQLVERNYHPATLDDVRSVLDALTNP